jgi:hypothetical protein
MDKLAVYHQVVEVVEVVVHHQFLQVVLLVLVQLM